MNIAYETLLELEADPQHPHRGLFEDMLDNVLERLRDGDDLVERGAAIKEELLAEPAVRNFACSRWADLRQSLLT